MSRVTGIFNFSGTLEPKAKAPLDARILVDKQADLTEDSTWQDSNKRSWVYVGMIVACKDSLGKLYQLIADDYTKASNWKVITGSSGDNTSVSGDYLPIIKDSTDIQQAGGDTIPITKFVGASTYDATTGELFLSNPSTTGADLIPEVISLPLATSTTAGLMSAEDKVRLDSMITNNNWDIIE